MDIQNNVYLPLPHAYEREGRQERAWDIYSRLLRDRIIFIGTQIDSYVTNKYHCSTFVFANGRPQEGCTRLYQFTCRKCCRRNGNL